MTAFVLALALAAAAPDTGAAGSALPIRLDPHGVLAQAGGGAPLLEPAGVAVDAFGRVYATDAGSSTLQRWDADGRWLDGTGALGDDPTQFRRPGAVVRLGSLGVAVLDVENRRLVAYDVHLRLLGVLADLRDPALEAQLGTITPVALAADRGGALVVADGDRDRLLVFDFSGRFLRDLGAYGARDGSFMGLAGAAFTPRGELVTVERPRARARGVAADSTTGRSRIQWFDAGGRPLAAAWLAPWGAARGPAGGLAIAVDDSGRVAVANEASGEVVLLGRDGTRLARAGGLAGPRGVAFAPDGALWVAESSGRRLARLTPVAAAGE